MTIDKAEESKKDKDLHKLKIRNYTLVAFVIGLVFIVISRYPTLNNYFKELFLTLGHTAIIAGVITIIFEYKIRNEALEILKKSLEEAMDKQTIIVKEYLKQNLEGALIQEFRTEREKQLKVIENSVEKAIEEQTRIIKEKLSQNLKELLTETLLTNSKVQLELLKECKLDDIIQTATISRLGFDMGKELCTGMIKPVIDSLASGHRNFLYGYKQTIRLDTLEQQNDFFLLSIAERYRCRLRTTTCKFSCVRNPKDFKYRLDSLKDFYTYQLPIKRDLIQDWFEILKLSIEYEGNEILLPKPDLKVNSEAITYIYELPKDMLDKEVLISCKIKTVILKKSNFFFYTIKDPTKDVSISFECGSETGIKHLEVIKHLITPGKHTTEDTDRKNYAGTTVSLDGWVAPGSGITFVWSS
jgi:hypothetical protein